VTKLAIAQIVLGVLIVGIFLLAPAAILVVPVLGALVLACGITQFLKVRVGRAQDE